jgi:hypothetical protein
MLAAKGGENSKPNKGWLKLARESLGQDDRLEIGEMLGQIVALHEPGSPLDLANQNALRGLVWLVAIAAPDVAAPDSGAAPGLRQEVPDILVGTFRISVARAWECGGSCF